MSDGKINVGGDVEIVDSPELEVYEAYTQLNTPIRPKITTYLGEKVDFFVTAIDTDDCTELTLEAITLLPYGGGTQATLGPYEYLTDYPEYPQGAKIRRRFAWSWDNPLSEPARADPRPRTSFICFYAFDKYEITATPFHWW